MVQAYKRWHATFACYHSAMTFACSKCRIQSQLLTLCGPSNSNPCTVEEGIRKLYRFLTQEGATLLCCGNTQTSCAHPWVYCSSNSACFSPCAHTLCPWLLCISALMQWTGDRPCWFLFECGKKRRQWSKPTGSGEYTLDNLDSLLPSVTTKNLKTLYDQTVRRPQQSTAIAFLPARSLQCIFWLIESLAQFTKSLKT